MAKHVRVAILGAGSAGLTAMSQVKRSTDSFLLIDGGELGTTCARVGCMPSKALIQIAEDYHRREQFHREGIGGAEGLSIAGENVLEHTQNLRDLFVDRVLSSTTDDLEQQFIAANARFTGPGRLAVDGEEITADTVVIATGSAPIVPAAWRAFDDRVLTTDTIFELESLPKSLAVIGLGVVGLELGQAFARLGVEVTGFDRLTRIANLRDEELGALAVELIGRDFALHLGHDVALREAGDGRLTVTAGDRSVTVEKVLVSMGRAPNVAGLDLAAVGIATGPGGIPAFDRHTMKIEGHPVFIAGDVTAERPILHEAIDEGRIAGHNAVAERLTRFRRKTPLTIAFTDPNIVMVGDIPERADDAEVIRAGTRFNMLGRALIMGRNRGGLTLYAAREDGRLLGAVLVAPGGEHLGHLLAWSIQQGLTAAQAIRMPFYHPVMEEALQPVLRELAAGTRRTPDWPLDIEKMD